MGRRFTVYTDEKGLRHVLEHRITTQNQLNWLAKLLGYDFDIVYKVGISNRVVDALPRVCGDMELQVISRSFWQDLEQIDKEVKADPQLSRIIEEIKREPDSHPYYASENGRLYYKGRLVVSTSSEWIPKLLQEFHIPLKEDIREFTRFIKG